MVAELVIFVGFFLLVEPFLVLAHELGHAAVVLAAGEDVSVSIGGVDGTRFDVGNLSLFVHATGLLSLVTHGQFYYEADLPRRWKIAAALAGPATTLVLLGATGAAFVTTSGVVGALARIATIYLAIQALVTIVPIQYPGWFGSYAGMKSDGRVALELCLRWDEAPNSDMVAPTPTED